MAYHGIPFGLQHSRPSTPSSRPTAPRRSESLGVVVAPTTPAQLFASIDDDLRDVRRVHAQGQEEDLRYALTRTIGRVEELTTLLKDVYKTNAELETQLTLAKSNLQLAFANNEMLEDALKRDTLGRGKDVGWRRWSQREGQERDASAHDRRASADAVPHSDDPVTPNSATPSPALPSEHPSIPAPPTSAPAAPSEGGFFRFRRTGSGGVSISGHNGSPAPSRNNSPPTLAKRIPSGLTSASMPSLLEDPAGVAAAAKKVEELGALLEKERAALAKTQDQKRVLVEELNGQLEKERLALQTARQDKLALEQELESLSQALFEEANRMVATERIKAAEAEEELRETRRQKDALRSALSVIEGENNTLRTIATSAGIDVPPSPSRSTALAGFLPSIASTLQQTQNRDVIGPAPPGHGHSRSSSTAAMKSPNLGPASASTSTRSRGSSLASATGSASRPSSPLVQSLSLADFAERADAGTDADELTPGGFATPDAHAGLPPASALSAAAPVLHIQQPTPPNITPAGPPGSTPAPVGVRPVLAHRASGSFIPTSMGPADILPRSPQRSPMSVFPSSAASGSYFPPTSSSSVPSSPATSPAVPRPVHAPDDVGANMWADVRSMSPVTVPALSEVAGRLSSSLGRVRALARSYSAEMMAVKDEDAQPVLLSRGPSRPASRAGEKAPVDGVVGEKDGEKEKAAPKPVRPRPEVEQMLRRMSSFDAASMVMH